MKYRQEYDRKLIGRNLKHLRKAKNLSVDEVRRYLCLGSVQAVYKYEKGQSYPQADTMFALMELYEADLNDIICNYEENHQAPSLALEHLDIISKDMLIPQKAKRLIRYFELYMEHREESYHH